jgi:hypothetical protein
MTKKNLKHIAFLIPLFGLTISDNPCQKNFYSEDWRNIKSVIFYPNCNDTTIFFVRTYENNKLMREEWRKNNMLDGISKYYSYSDSNGVETTETLWSKSDILQTINYFPNSVFISSMNKQISDSSIFEMKYYKNGNTREYGNSKVKRYCRYGVWTECDSLGMYKWEGEYKIVNREKKDTTWDKKTGDEYIVTTFTCSEKTGVWKKLGKNDTVLEQVIYVNGIIKTTR